MRCRCSLTLATLILAVGALVLISAPASAQKASYDPPTLSCAAVSPSKVSIDLEICGGGTTGAPAGVSVHWKKLSDYNAAIANGQDGWVNDGTLCELSLSGMPGRDHGNADSRWDLAAGQCEVIRIGDNLFDETGASSSCVDSLECDTEYIFRTFAHADRDRKRSAWSANVICRTAPCDDGCVRTQGFWKTHGPDGQGVFDCLKGQNANEWNVTSLTLGTTHSYTAAELCAILNTDPKSCGAQQGANALVKLAHQLIAALLNQAAGADVSCVQTTILQAHLKIGTLKVAPTQGATCVGNASTLGQEMEALAKTLDDYNQGFLVCEQPCPPGSQGSARAAPTGATDVKRSSWGGVKVIYR